MTWSGSLDFCISAQEKRQRNSKQNVCRGDPGSAETCWLCHCCSWQKSFFVSKFLQQNVKNFKNCDLGKLLKQTLGNYQLKKMCWNMTISFMKFIDSRRQHTDWSIGVLFRRCWLDRLTQVREKYRSFQWSASGPPFQLSWGRNRSTAGWERSKETVALRRVVTTLSKESDLLFECIVLGWLIESTVVLFTW